jgi:hypothetical protein
VGFLLQELREGRFPFGQLLAVKRPAPGGSAETLCLLDGHHRVIACSVENRLPPTCRVPVTSAPIALGTAVLDGGLTRAGS